jgi:hypothetical protein
MQRVIEIGGEVGESRFHLLACHPEGAPTTRYAVIYLSCPVVEDDPVQPVIVLLVAEDVDRRTWE